MFLLPPCSLTVTLSSCLASSVPAPTPPPNLPHWQQHPFPLTPATSEAVAAPHRQPLSCCRRTVSSLCEAPQSTVNPKPLHLQQRHWGKLQWWQLEEATCNRSCHRRSLEGEPSDLAVEPHRELGRVKAVSGGDATITVRATSGRKGRLHCRTRTRQWWLLEIIRMFGCFGLSAAMVVRWSWTVAQREVVAWFFVDGNELSVLPLCI